MRLATRIIILIILITLLMGMLTVYFSAPVIKQGFRIMDEEWIGSLNASLSEGIANDTINGNATRVRQILETVVQKNKELDYAYVVGFEGNIFAHSFKEGFPEKLIKLVRRDQEHLQSNNHSKELRDLHDDHDGDHGEEVFTHSESIKLDGVNIEDVSQPIIEGMSAELHLGLNSESDEVLLQEIDQKLIWIILMLGMAGVLVALPVSHQLTKPLDIFGRHMRDYGNNKIKSKFDTNNTSSEVNELGEIFNNMIDELEEKQNLFEAMFESISDAVIVADTERRITIINSAAKNLLQYDENEMIGNSTSMIYAHPEDYGQTGKQRYNADAKGDPLAYEVEYQRKDGTSFIGETLGTKIISAEGDNFGFVGIIRDVTDRKSAEQALQQFKGTLDKTLDCVFLFDADNLHFYYVNEGAMQQIGYSNSELMTMHPYDIKPEISKAGFLELIAPLVSGEKVSLNFETVHQHKDGKFIPVEIFLQYISGENEAARFVAIVRDITDRKEIQTELENHREHLEELVVERTQELHDTQDELVRKERLATLGQLTATVSHELRNPLGAMRPSLYVIEKKSDKDDEKMQNAIQRVDRNIERCDRIIDELLDFTRITELNLETTCIDDWLGTVIDDQNIPEGISLEKDFSLKNIKLDIDTDRLRRAVINVFENACHAMMDDNQKLVNKEDSYLIINTGVTDKRIEITIADTGSGIKKDILEKIFEPLFSTKGFGVGLGMPTVKQIMEQHYGGIEINSEENKGTRVILWLPKHNKGDAA